MRRLLCILLGVAVCGPLNAAMVMFNPDATWIRAGGPDAIQDVIDPTRVNADNFGQSTENRILLRDDTIFATVPLGATIDSAILTLYKDDGSNNLQNVHQVFSNWSENTVTWNSFNMGGVAGTDYAAVPGTSFTPGSAVDETNDIDVTSIVQAWSNGDANEGIIIISTGLDGVTYRSDDTLEAVGAPVLTVDFSTAVIPEPSSWLLFTLVACIFVAKKLRPWK